MKSYTDPSFQERLGRAAEAKQKALDNLRSRPPLDEKVVAERQAARLKREVEKAGKRAARIAADQSAREARAAAAAASRDSTPAPLTDAEKKLARDARYAARKNRK